MKLAALAILFMPASVVAQIELPDTTYLTTLDLYEVVVTGTRVSKLLKDTPVQTRLITAKDIARTDATNIADLLQAELPGVEFSYAMNQQVHMNFGGFGGQSVLFLVDGERLAGETMDDVDFSRFDMNNIERIEIVRGASSALYVSNAGGGVINIITKEAAKNLGANLDLRIARHNGRRYIIGLSNKSNCIGNSLSVTASRMNSYDVKNASNPLTRVVSTIFGHKTLNAKEQFSLLPFDGVKLTARAGLYMRELPRDIDAPERYRSYSAGLKGEWDITNLDHLELSYSFDQYDKSQYRNLTGLDIRNYSNVQSSVRGLFNHNFGYKDILTVGADYLHDYLLNTKLIDSQYHQDNFDIFTQYDWTPNEKWEIVGTARYDYFSDGHHSHFTPKVSARFTPHRRLNLRAAYGIGFRAPTLKEKYYEFDMAGIWIVKGNPALKPETSHNFNASADYTRGQYNFTATAYYNYVKDRITTGLPYYASTDRSQLYLDYIRKEGTVKRNSAVVTFMELNMIMWASYLVLLLCYDNQILGDHHPVTLTLAFGCLAGSLFMFRDLLKCASWGKALRQSIATVIVFWTFVEVMGRLNFLKEIWVEPFTHVTEMLWITVSFVVVVIVAILISRRKRVILQ